MAACPLGYRWEFYLINDSESPLDWAVLTRINYEWGDWSNTEDVDVRVTSLAPGASARIWTDNGDGAELRMELSLQVGAGNREGPLIFEFPKLYLLRNLPSIAGLGRPGWEQVAEL